MTIHEFKKEYPDLYRQIRTGASRSLAKLGKEMRAAQNRYFRTRSIESLNESKRLELQFDRSTDAIIKSE